MLKHVRRLIQRPCLHPTSARYCLFAWLLSLFTLLPLSAAASVSTGAFNYPATVSVALSAPERVREGNFQLSVEQRSAGSDAGNHEPKSWVIEQSNRADFESVVASYAPVGSFQQLSLSGFDDGDYFFRARLRAAEPAAHSTEQTFSNVVKVEVRHYPLWQALSVFSVGAALFFILCLTLWRLQRQAKLATQ